MARRFESAWLVGAALVTALAVHPACAPEVTARHLTDRQLLEEVLQLEKEVAGLEGPARKDRVRAFGARMVGATITVEHGTVVASYDRGEDWTTRPYYAVDYDREGYVYLDELDPAFQADVARPRPWASVAVTHVERQLMFELALDAEIAPALRPGMEIAFTCELAAVIRGGKSVYCRAVALRAAQIFQGLPSRTVDPIRPAFRARVRKSKCGVI